MSRLFSAALVLALTLFLPSAAFACSCMQQPVSQQARNAEVVFIGRAVRTERLDRYQRVTTFRVQETLKGGRASTRRIYHRENDGGNCGINFRRGERMLMSAVRSEGRLTTNSCSMPMGSEAEFRRALGRRGR